MAWFLNPSELIKWAKELYYGPPPPAYVCDKDDFLCEWTKGEHNLRDLPTKIINVPFSYKFQNSFWTGAILAGAGLMGIPKLAVRGVFWVYKLLSARSNAQISAEAGWLSINYWTANVLGYCTGCPNLTFLAACAIDLSYKYNYHPEQCPGAAADMLVGYVAFGLGDRIVNFCFQAKKDQGEDNVKAAPKIKAKRSYR